MSFEIRQFIHSLAEKSAEVIRPYYFNRDLKVELKENETPVTAADKKAEEVMRDLIRKKFPDHGIVGEEYGDENDNAEFVWILDPIDGTISFTRGSPLFGTLIGLFRNGQPIFGAIHQPILNQLCIGDNKETRLNGKPVRVRETADLSSACLLTTDLGDIDKYQNRGRFEDLANRCEVVRTWGDCYGYLLVACGWADLMMDPIVNPWDINPLIPVIRGAGGVITEWAGGNPVNGGSCVAGSPTAHAAAMVILNP